jgi:endonuclease-3
MQKEKEPDLYRQKRLKAGKIIKILRRLFPNPGTELKYSTPFELLVAVILSAQSTDKKVNEVTRKLFKKYNSIEDYANADIKELEKDISSLGLFRTKARNIIAAAQIIKERYSGKVPSDMDDLLSLPGVGRKTANVVLGVLYHKASGIAVDTHVARLARLFGLSNSWKREDIEKDLLRIIPKKDWIDFSHLLILYGRQYCTAHCKHKTCPLRNFIQVFSAA